MHVIRVVYDFIVFNDKPRDTVTFQRQVERLSDYRKLWSILSFQFPVRLFSVSFRYLNRICTVLTGYDWQYLIGLLGFLYLYVQRFLIFVKKVRSCGIPSVLVVSNDSTGGHCCKELDGSLIAIYFCMPFRSLWACSRLCSSFREKHDCDSLLFHQVCRLGYAYDSRVYHAHNSWCGRPDHTLHTYRLKQEEDEEGDGGGSRSRRTCSSQISV